jgi:GntR family transcriptional regulator
MFINSGARNLLLQAERQKFLEQDWPRISENIRRLGITPQELFDTPSNSKPKKEER